MNAERVRIGGNLPFVMIEALFSMNRAVDV